MELSKELNILENLLKIKGSGKNILSKAIESRIFSKKRNRPGLEVFRKTMSSSKKLNLKTLIKSNQHS